MVWSVEAIITLSIYVLLSVMFEWSKIKEKKEKVVFISLICSGIILSIVLLLFPEMPGPTQLVNIVFKPIGDAVFGKS